MGGKRKVESRIVRLEADMDSCNRRIDEMIKTIGDCEVRNEKRSKELIYEIHRIRDLVTKISLSGFFAIFSMMLHIVLKLIFNKGLL